MALAPPYLPRPFGPPLHKFHITDESVGPGSSEVKNVPGPEGAVQGCVVGAVSPHADHHSGHERLQLVFPCRNQQGLSALGAEVMSRLEVCGTVVSVGSPGDCPMLFRRNEIENGNRISQAVSYRSYPGFGTFFKRKRICVTLRRGGARPGSGVGARCPALSNLRRGAGVLVALRSAHALGGQRRPLPRREYAHTDRCGCEPRHEA